MKKTFRNLSVVCLFVSLDQHGIKTSAFSTETFQTCFTRRVDQSKEGFRWDGRLEQLIANRKSFCAPPFRRSPKPVASTFRDSTGSLSCLIRVRTPDYYPTTQCVAREMFRSVAKNS